MTDSFMVAPSQDEHQLWKKGKHKGAKRKIWEGGWSKVTHEFFLFFTADCRLGEMQINERDKIENWK